ncbi:hypothetical protein Tco_0517157 [Tanacetum coccineum]
MVAIRLHQPWIAILSVLNRYLMGKGLNWDTVRLPILQILWGIIHSANLDFASLIWDEFEWQTVKRSSRPSIMSKLLYTRFTKLIIEYLLSFNKSIPRRSDSKLHSSQDDHPITKLLNTTNRDYKFGMKVPDAMISDAIKKKVGYKYYIAKKVENEKAKIVNEPEEQHISLIKSGRGKGFMWYGDQVANVPNKLKKDVVPRRTRPFTIAKEAVVDKLGQKLKGPAVEDPVVQSLLDLQKGSKASMLESLRKMKQPEIDDADESNMDLPDDNPHGDDDDARYGVFMYNKSTATPNSTYFSPTVTSSSLDFIQSLLDKTPAYKLIDFMSHPVYTDAQTTLVVHNPEGNPKLTSYISCASKVPLGTHVDVLATKTLIQSKEADARGEKNMRKFDFKKAVTQKFKEYDQKLEALTNFNVSEAFEKVIQAKVLTKIKKLLPTHISNAIANYVKTRLKTSMLELKPLNRIHLSKSNDTHTTHQQLYETIYESIILDQDPLDAQAIQSSFYKRSHDNQDPHNNREEEKKKKCQKDVGEPSSISSRQNRSPVDENHILGPSTVAIAKKFKELIQKDELTIADFKDLNTKEKYTTSITKHYAARYYKEGIEDRIPKRWSKEVCRYNFKALNGIHHWEEDRIVFFKPGISVITEGNIFSDFRIKSIIRIDVKKKWGCDFLTSILVRKFDDKEYEFSYADLPRLNVNDVEDMYLLQKNRDQEQGGRMKLSELKKFSDGTLVKIKENLIEMLSKNKLGSGNKRLKVRDWTDYNVKSSIEMLKKIDEILRHKEQLLVPVLHFYRSNSLSLFKV